MVVDSGWVKALATVFAENAEVMAVTGLVVPYEIETEAQLLFEQCGGFGRGFERRRYRVNTEREVEIIVVDRNPSSGLIASVVARFSRRDIDKRTVRGAGLRQK